MSESYNGKPGTSYGSQPERSYVVYGGELTRETGDGQLLGWNYIDRLTKA